MARLEVGTAGFLQVWGLAKLAYETNKRPASNKKVEGPRTDNTHTPKEEEKVKNQTWLINWAKIGLLLSQHNL